MSQSSSSKNNFIKIIIKEEDEKNTILVDAKDKEKSLQNILDKNKLIALYFSAQFCSPCKQFTPKLIKAYNIWKEDKCGIEVVYVSSDETEKDYKANVEKHPWKRICFKQRDLCDKIMDCYNIKSIPQLWIFDCEGNLISKKGTEEVATKGSKAIQNWLK